MKKINRRVNILLSSVAQASEMATKYMKKENLALCRILAENCAITFLKKNNKIRRATEEEVSLYYGKEKLS